MVQCILGSPLIYWNKIIKCAAVQQLMNLQFLYKINVLIDWVKFKLQGETIRTATDSTSNSLLKISACQHVLAIWAVTISKPPTLLLCLEWLQMHLSAIFNSNQNFGISNSKWNSEPDQLNQYTNIEKLHCNIICFVHVPQYPNALEYCYYCTALPIHKFMNHEQIVLRTLCPY